MIVCPGSADGLLFTPVFCLWRRKSTKMKLTRSGHLAVVLVGLGDFGGTWWDLVSEVGLGVLNVGLTWWDLCGGTCDCLRWDLCGTWSVGLVWDLCGTCWDLMSKVGLGVLNVGLGGTL